MVDDDANGTPEKGALSSLRINALVLEADTCMDCLDLAAVAAEIDPRAKIRALYVQEDFVASGASAEEIDIRILGNLKYGTPSERLDAVKAAYHRWCHIHAGSSVRWTDYSGRADKLLLKEANGWDLTVMIRPRSMDGRSALHSLLSDGNRLILHGTNAPLGTVGRRMAIAWTPNDRASKAVEKSFRWLAQAEHVDVLIVNRVQTVDLAPLHSLLNGHGIQFTDRFINSEGLSVGEALLREAKYLGADSMVIGSYHRGGFFEGVLVGVTRYILDQADIPVFLAH